jgi:hypothetical protein
LRMRSACGTVQRKWMAVWFSDWECPCCELA